MPTAKDKALVGVGGAVGLSLAAWRAFFPWIGYDLAVMRIGRKYGKLVMDDLANERYLIDMFERTVKANLKKTFVIFQDRMYTYEFMNEQACRVANIAIQLGLKLGDTAAILIQNHPSFIWTFLGKYHIHSKSSN